MIYVTYATARKLSGRAAWPGPALSGWKTTAMHSIIRSPMQTIRMNARNASIKSTHPITIRMAIKHRIMMVLPQIRLERWIRRAKGTNLTLLTRTMNFDGLRLWQLWNENERWNSVEIAIDGHVRPPGLTYHRLCFPQTSSPMWPQEQATSVTITNGTMQWQATAPSYRHINNIEQSSRGQHTPNLKCNNDMWQQHSICELQSITVRNASQSNGNQLTNAKVELDNLYTRLQ